MTKAPPGAPVMQHGKRPLDKGSSAKNLPANDYGGYVLTPDQRVGKVRYSDLSPGGFFNDFVAPRKPVLIDGCLAESDGWRGDKWTNQYLRDKAGDAEVKVEFRAGADERFGQGLEKTMRFGDFIDELERKDDLLYLTTQELGLDPTGRPSVMSAPLDRLRGDYPLRPRLAGALVPQNVNLWMGHTKKGASSSGLHHDFHDNLYVLLRGKKRFRLFSPADAHRMYLEGELEKVHPNGRINYKGRETLADGSDPLAETAARAAEMVDRAAKKAEDVAAAVPGGSVPVQESGERDELDAQSRKFEEEAAAAQAALERGESGAVERLAAAEEELERALEAVLDAECAGGGGFGDGGSGDSSSDSEGGPGFFDGINDNPSEEAFLACAKKAKERRGLMSGASGGGGGGAINDDSASEGGGGGPGSDLGAYVVDDADSHDAEALDEAGGRANSNGHSGVDSHAERAGTAKVDEEGARSGHVKDDMCADARRGNSSGSSSRSCSAGRRLGSGGGGAAPAAAGAAAACEGRAAKRKKGIGKQQQQQVAGTAEGEKEAARNGKESPPSNFSKVDPSLPQAELAERFPLFLEAESCTVEVGAGQMLFLPAGWFHEVFSEASENGHMAFNYWFHPPDSFHSASAPYKSSFWQRDWEGCEREGAIGAEGDATKTVV